MGMNIELVYYKHTNPKQNHFTFLVCVQYFVYTIQSCQYNLHTNNGNIWWQQSIIKRVLTIWSRINKFCAQYRIPYIGKSCN
jgi:hypothetical protein